MNRSTPTAGRRRLPRRHADVETTAPRCEPLEGRLLFVAGELDFTFSGDGRQTTDFGNTDAARAVAIQPDGKTVVAGHWDGGAADFAVARYDQGGNLDPTFSGDGRANLTFGAGAFGGVERATGVALQPDGKIVVVGYTDAGTTGGINPFDFAVARFNADGSIDNTFSGDGKFTHNFGHDDRAAAVAIQPDGKIVVAGQWDGGSADMAVIRLNPNGTFDTSFNDLTVVTAFNGDGKVPINFSGGSIERATSLALAPDGDIIVGGYTNFGTSGIGADVNDFAVARLNSAGELDLSFSGDGKQSIDFGYNDQANAVAVDRRGRILLAGFDDGGAADFAVARLLANGNLDPSFNDVATPSNWNGDGKLSFTFRPGSVFGGVERAFAIALEPNGIDQEIYVAGFTDHGPAGTADNFALARVRPNGTLDTSFGGGDGLQITDFGGDDEAYGIAVGADSKVVVAGGSAGNFAVARYLAELDPSFGFDGKQLLDFGHTDAARAVVVQPDGRIVVAGEWDGGAADFAVARFLPSGALDGTFDGDGRQNVFFGAAISSGIERATSLALQPDGKIVVGGYTNFSGAGTNFDFAVARLNPDGSLDNTFSGDGKFTYDWGNDDRVHALALQPDGKIVLVGQWAGSAPDFAIMRLNTNGTLDNTFSGDGRQNLTFGAGTFGGDERANALAVAPDGDIWVAGFTDANATAGNPRDFAIARFNPDGSVDNTFSGDGRFTIDFGDDDQATGIALRPDGRLVVGGTSDDGTAEFAVAQIRGNDLDASFGGGDGKLELFSNDATEFSTGLALMENGKIMMVGYSNSATGSPNNFAVARVLANGSGTDPSFNADGEHFVDFGGNDQAYAVAIQPDRKVVVVGGSNGNFAVARYDSAPAVTQVYVSSSSWAPEFLNYLAAQRLGSALYGYAVPAGPSQLLELPWINLDRVSVTFSENVGVDNVDMALTGVNTANYPLNGGLFGYNAATRTATWALNPGTRFTVDRLTLNLDADSNNGVRTALGATLDGDWLSGGTEVYPSGDGAAGGDFRFRLNVLPGGADRLFGRVNAADQGYVKARINRTVTAPNGPPGSAPYTIFADVNGDGRVNAADQGAVKARLNNALPPGPVPEVLFSSRRIADELLA